ncbi:MAG: AGE family epimerase/isomerase, partial [Muribaculaceae bacterium]|nr:AGE family epimerase/isomerase [Muribaculaceae bacterium]
SKTMNTHLHILEAYTNLLRVWRSEECLEATSSLLRLFNDTIVNPKTGHMGLFFDDDMRRVDNDTSYGHDIEASWLMLEAAQVIGDPLLTAETLDTTRFLALSALEGMQPDGSMIYELHGSGSKDEERHWWVQAENIVGLLYLARFHNLPEFLDKAWDCWEYTKNNIVDHINGEWHWSRLPDGSVNRRDDKAGFWKCPYHNSRMCMEAARQLKAIFE